MTVRPVDPPDWIALQRLNAQYRTNMDALTQRDPSLASTINARSADILIRSQGDTVQIALRSASGDLAIQPNPLPAVAAAAVTAKLFPSRVYNQPILVAGLDQAWLWRQLHDMPTAAPAAPGHRLPLYLTCFDPLQLWIVLHIQDLRAMLLDPRVMLFVGPDAIEQFIGNAAAHPMLPLPRMSVTVDPRVWPKGQSLDSAMASIGNNWERRYAELQPQLREIETRFGQQDWAARVRDGRPLRILGITSRFTTFLQYSMRDWADSLRSLGHDVQVLIESADHEQMHPLAIAEAAAAMRPDLVLLIDHFRAEFTGLPRGIPTVMWVQDRLPNIFNATAGARQQRTDYVLGQGRTECVHSHGYPQNRFMSSMIGTNPQRFIRSGSSKVSPCDISFVSHCSLPAETIIAEEIARTDSPEATRLLTAVFDQLKAIYDAGQSITQPYRIEAIIRQCLIDTATTVSNLQPVLDLFTHRINNTLYRHQAIGWVAEMGVNLRLYGRGWESHPTLSRFACGVADNESQLPDIYRASAINLQITPFGAAHQRLFDGLAAGGFFLMRRTHGDRYDQVQRDVWQRCNELQITNDQQLLESNDAQLLSWIRELDEIDGKPTLGRGYDYVSELTVTAREGFIRSAGTIWPEFEAVSFDDNHELQQKITSFLAAPVERQRLVEEMSKRVMSELTYQAISQKLLDFIADDLSPLGARIAA